jgi:glyoxylase-like metal-dependent hydrolase (beta-lactamase superfamily II)
MATAAEPQAAKLPLPGGRDGATVRLTPLLTGTCAGPPGWIHREEGRLAPLRAYGIGVPRERWPRLPVPAFLVEHPGAGRLLVDTGLHPSVAAAPRENLGRLFLMIFKDFEMTAEQAVPAQLRALGIDPASVGTVVMTHLHGDHASAMSEFPGAMFLFSAQEWRAATEQGARHGYVRRQFDHAFDYRTIDFESPDIGSFSTFGRALDLFGDGSVRLAFTPGHTRGHMSVVLRLHDRDAVLCGDAAYTMRTFETGHLPGATDDEHRFRRSLRELQLFARESPGAVVVPGHDLEAWQALDPVYE